MKQCRWVKPKLVCPVAFVEWADAGHLGHCTFVPMRDDKKTCGGNSRNLRRAEHLSLPTQSADRTDSLRSTSPVGKGPFLSVGLPALNWLALRPREVS